MREIVVTRRNMKKKVMDMQFASAHLKCSMKSEKKSWKQWLKAISSPLCTFWCRLACQAFSSGRTLEWGGRLKLHPHYYRATHPVVPIGIEAQMRFDAYQLNKYIYTVICTAEVFWAARQLLFRIEESNFFMYCGLIRGWGRLEKGESKSHHHLWQPFMPPTEPTTGQDLI